MADDRMSRREFAGLTTAGIAGGMLGSLAVVAGPEATADWDPARPLLEPGVPLRMQPVLMHTIYTPRPKASWRSWSQISTPAAVAEEVGRITKELESLSKAAGFPLEFLPLLKVASVDEARKVHEQDHDVVLLYPATGSGEMLRACFAQRPDRDTVLFARHRAGEIYYWYEALSTRYLQKNTPEELAEKSIRQHGPPTVDDVVIDDYAEVLWRLRALYGLKNFVGRRVVALGGVWGKYDPTAPQVAREKYGLAPVEVGYDELSKRLARARADKELLGKVESWTETYLAQPLTQLGTEKSLVASAMLLYRVIKDLLAEHDTPVFTIRDCMTGALPIVETTPCLALSWLNDEGLLAFCESDFVVVPPGILLRYVAGTPVFLHNSTFPHKGIVTCAHCSAPRRMDGKSYAPAKILTHYESDFGAAPKVDFAVGQEVTLVDPEYATGRWVGMKGVIRDNPFLPICRTQQDVEIQGDWPRLRREARDSHWLMVYGDHLRAVGYAARKIGVHWDSLSETS